MPVAAMDQEEDSHSPAPIRVNLAAPATSVSRRGSWREGSRPPTTGGGRRAPSGEPSSTRLDRVSSVAGIFVQWGDGRVRFASMQMAPDDFRALADHLSTLHVRAPRSVMASVLSLIDSAPDASVVQARESDGNTAWRVAWLARDFVAFAEGRRQESDWDLESRDQQADVITAWLRPVRDIRSVAVGRITDLGREFSSAWSWRAEYAVTFSDGAEISLPLFGGTVNRQESERAEAFAVALRKAWLDCK